MKVDAYLNLHRDCVSVRSRETEDYGRVVAHHPCINMCEAFFVVQEAGRERAREEGVRNVHAFVRGNWDEDVQVIDGVRVKYDPFGVGEFFVEGTGRIVEYAERAKVTRSGVCAEGVTYTDENV